MAVEDPNILTEDDLFDIYKEVLDVAAEWRNVGLALRVRNPELDVIEKSCPLAPRDCLRAVLAGWLKGRNGPQPTWGALCEAVAEPAGGNNRVLAEEMARKHGVTLKACEDINIYSALHIYMA